MPLVRTRYLGDDDVIVQRKVWFLPRSWNIAWYDYASLRSNLHNLESKLSKALSGVDKLLQSWSTEKEHLDAEVKAIKQGKFNRFGVSEPFYIKEKGLRSWIGGQTYVPRPEESWKAMLNPVVLIKYGLRGKVGKPTSIPGASIPNQRGGNTRYTLPEHKDLGLHIEGVDQVVAFKEEKSNTSNVSKSRMKQIRSENPKQSGESDQEWNKRIQMLASQSEE